MEIHWEEGKVQDILGDNFVVAEEEVVNTKLDSEESMSVFDSVVEGGDVEAFNVDEEEEEEPKEKRQKLQCGTCGATFRRNITLKYHSTVHVDECFYACEFCSATKIHWSEFFVHQCTSGNEKPLMCPQCNKTVSTKKQLGIHEEVHSLQRRFTTKRLDSYFKKKLEEAEDKEVDWGAKPFLCGVCGKPFSKLYEVEYHEKLHNNERPAPHVCTNCDMRYINKQDLNKHLARGCAGEATRKIIPTPIANNGQH